LITRAGIGDCVIGSRAAPATQIRQILRKDAWDDESTGAFHDGYTCGIMSQRE
jgi:hypothetical protein